MTSEARAAGRGGGFPAWLRPAGFFAAMAGAAGSATFTLQAGRRNPSLVLMALFLLWVLSPFAALILADVVSKRWTAVRGATLYGLMLLLAAGSLAIYGVAALGRPRAKPAFLFLVVPLASWLAIAVAVAIDRRKRRVPLR